MQCLIFVMSEEALQDVSSECHTWIALLNIFKYDSAVRSLEKLMIVIKPTSILQSLWILFVQSQED
jgi:hypothetical protein